MIKVIATGAVLTSGTNPGAPEFTEEELRAIVEEATSADAFVAAHAHGAEGIKRAIRAGVRSIEHGSLMDDEAIAMLADNGTWLVADLYDGDYINNEGPRLGYDDETLRKSAATTDAQRKGFEKCVEAGVKLAFGTDAGVFPHADAGKQFAYLVRHGLDPLAAIAGRHQQRRRDDRLGRPRWLAHPRSLRRPDRGCRKPARGHHLARIGELGNEGGVSFPPKTGTISP